jgi:hypothetical protein
MSENKINYSEDFELFLKQEAEKAEAMSILHTRSYQRFNRFSVFINIPVIVLSSIIGFLAPLQMFDGQAVLLGSLSIFIAILKTVDNFFDFTKRCETHRMTSLNYGRISKMLQIQLSLERDCRIKAQDLFDIVNNDLQNICDAEPIIPDTVIRIFNAKYGEETTSKPAITNGLTQVKINTSRPTSPAPLPIPAATVNEIVTPLELPTLQIVEDAPTQQKPAAQKKPPFR